MKVYLSISSIRNVIVLILEINILWAAHQVHHSSEDYNLTTALRQSLKVFAVVSSPDWMKRTIIKLAIFIFKTFRKSYTYTHYVKKYSV